MVTFMTLETFLNHWEKEYNKKAKDIEIFQTELTSQWSAEQKSKFASVFYHLRGHFHDFLWYVGSHADDQETKDIIHKLLGPKGPSFRTSLAA